MSPWMARPSTQTRRGRQIEMQNWHCCFCGGRHAWWYHDHPLRDVSGQVIPVGAVPDAGEDGDSDGGERERYV